MPTPHLSIVVPAHDEAATIEASVAALYDWIGASALDAELIVVDDGSEDGTVAAARRAIGRRAGRVLCEKEQRGKGYAVRQGLLAARGRWALVTDADLSAPLADYAKLATALRDRDLDVVCGSRYLPGSSTKVERSPLRSLAGRIFNLAVRVTTGLTLSDTQCGFKLLDLGRVRPLVRVLCVDGFAWDVELLFLCRRFGLSVAEVPVGWQERRRSNIRLLTDPWPMLWEIVRLRGRLKRGGYDAVADELAEPEPPGARAAGD